MFDYTRLNKPLKYPLISQDYKDILFDDSPILYFGKNNLGNYILGSSIDEDPQNKLEWFFHIVVSQSDKDDFFSKKVTFLNLMESSEDIFIIEKSFDNELMRADTISINEIPEDYLPTDQSFCPDFSTPTHSINHRLHVDGCDAKNHILKTAVFDSLVEEIPKIIEFPITMLKNFNFKNDTYISALHAASFEINFITEITTVSNDLFFQVDLQNITNLIDKFLKYSIENFYQDFIKNDNEILSHQADELKNEFIELFNNYHISTPENFDNIFFNTLKKCLVSISGMSKHFDHSFDSMEFWGTNQLFSINKSNLEYYKDLSKDIDRLRYTEEEGKYKITPYQLNVDTNKGKAFLFINDLEAKISIEIIDQSIKNSKYTKSLHTNEAISAQGTLVLKDNEPYKLIIRE